jgi:hypothetical protein
MNRFHLGISRGQKYKTKKMIKNTCRYIGIVVLMIVINFNLNADVPPPPGGSGGSGPGGSDLPVGAPVNNGIGLLLLLGLAYGVFRIIKIANEIQTEK